MPGVTSKKCRTCKIDGIPITDFIYKDENGEQGVMEDCIRCWRLIKKAEKKAFIRKHIANITKKCIGCKLELPATSFTRDASRRDGLCTRCKPCQKTYSENYAAAHPEARKRYVLRAKINRLVKDGKMSLEEASGIEVTVGMTDVE
jgi:hypothetical protein